MSVAKGHEQSSREIPSIAGSCEENAIDTTSQINFLTPSFGEQAVRRGFIKKVYLILMAQLLVTVTFICVFIFVKPIKKWVHGTDGLIVYLVAYGIFLVTFIFLFCCTTLRRKYPHNFICLAIFTLVMSYMLATISSFHSTKIVLIAMGITALMCLSISLFAIQTKIDFTTVSALVFVVLIVLLYFGIASLVLMYGVGYDRFLDIVYGSLVALVFGFIMVIDTQMIVGGSKRKYQLDPEEYIFAALQVYLDIVYLFLIILALFGGGSKN